MATTFKTLTNNDSVATRTLLHEAIPITGTIISGTYNDENIKDYSHGLFQSVYDYPYLSSSANHIFDLAFGFSTSSAVSGTDGTRVQTSEKINMYNQMAQVLVGYDENNAIREFDRDGDFAAGGTKINTAFFINFSRLLTKDEIKKGSFILTIQTGGLYTGPGDDLTIQDHGAATTYKTNSPTGEYGILYSGSQAEAGSGIGLVYYQAGIAVITASIFQEDKDGSAFEPNANYFGNSSDDVQATAVDMYASSSISASCNALRNRIKNIEFNNTTELNSSIYFCRASHNEFNYSSNPTYVTGSKIHVKNTSLDSPVSYITTVGMYSADNELLAVAKLSEPLKKDPTNEITLRVRLDY